MYGNQKYSCCQQCRALFLKNPADPPQRQNEKRHIVYKHDLVVRLIKGGRGHQKRCPCKGKPDRNPACFQPEKAQNAAGVNPQQSIASHQIFHLHRRKQASQQHIRSQQTIISKVIPAAASSQRQILWDQPPALQHRLPQSLCRCCMLAVPVSHRSEVPVCPHRKQLLYGNQRQQKKHCQPISPAFSTELSSHGILLPSARVCKK